MKYEGPGALHWAPSAVRRSWRPELAAACVGFALGALAFAALVATRPTPAPEPARPVAEAVSAPVPPLEPAPPPSTLTAPYSHAAATGTLRLPPDIGANVGLMVFPYAPRDD